MSTLTGDLSNCRPSDNQSTHSLFRRKLSTSRGDAPPCMLVRGVPLLRPDYPVSAYQDTAQPVLTRLAMISRLMPTTIVAGLGMTVGFSSYCVLLLLRCSSLSRLLRYKILQLTRLEFAYTGLGPLLATASAIRMVNTSAATHIVSLLLNYQVRTVTFNVLM